MKKLFLLFFVTCFCCDVIFAQNNSKNLEYYNAKLDSVILKYSIDTNKNPFNDVCNFDNADLTEMDRQKIIDKIKNLFEQDKYSNLHSLAHVALYNLWQIYPIKNTAKIKQKLLELFLKYYFYPGQRGYPISSDYSDLNIRNDYTKQAKKRIFNMLEGDKSQEEYAANLLFVKSIPEYMNSCERRARRVISKQQAPNDTIFEHIKDSFCNEYILNTAKTVLAEEQIQSDIILMAGFLGMKECIPTMQKNLQAEIAENKYHRNTEIAYRLALAKLGDKEQYQYTLDTIISTEYFTKNFLSYFRDDNITWRYVNANYSSSGSYYNGDFYVPMRLYTMDAICPFIEDMPKDLKFKRKTKNEDYKNAETLYEWLMKNRDSVKFNYDVNDGWFWSD